MTRQECNQVIMNYLQETLNTCPDLRFKQLLIIGGIIKDSHNDFNEESRTTLKHSKITASVSSEEESDILFTCQCESPQHQFIIRTHEGWEDEIFVEIHLNPLSFYKRLRYGIKYIFGKYNNFSGDFEEMILKKSDANKLQRIVNKLKKPCGKIIE